MGTVVLASESLLAEPIKINGGVEAVYTDNARQTAFDEDSDVETRVNIGVQHRTDPGKCNSELAARLGYGYWHEDAFDPEVYTNLDFFGDCRLGNNLVWNVSDQLRDVVEDNRLADNPDNRTRKNVFRTGPILSLRLSDVDRLSLSAEYENTEFSENDEPDSDRYIGTASWTHLFSPTLNAGLTARADKAELDNDEEIERGTLTATFSNTWAATRLSGSLGYSQVESTLNNVSQSSDGVVGSLHLARDINPSTELTLEASRELTDQTSDFDIRFGEFVFNLEQTSVVEVSLVRLGLNKQFSSGAQFSTAVFATRSDYLATGLREERSGISADYSRPVTGRFSVSAGGSYDYLTYSDSGDDDELINLKLGADYQFTRKLTMNGKVGHTQRTSDAIFREYKENWVLLGLNYQFR